MKMRILVMARLLAGGVVLAMSGSIRAAALGGYTLIGTATASSVNKGVSFNSFFVNSSMSATLSPSLQVSNFSDGRALANAYTDSNYVGFTITPTTGYRYDLDSLKFTYSQLAWVDWGLESSVKGFSGDLSSLLAAAAGGAGGTSGNASVTLNYTNLTSATEFRIYCMASTNLGVLALASVSLVGDTQARANLSSSVSDSPASRVMQDTANVRWTLNVTNNSLTAGTVATEGLNYTMGLGGTGTGLSLSSTSGSNLAGQSSATAYVNVDTSTLGLKNGAGKTITITSTNAYSNTSDSYSLTSSVAVVTERTVTGNTLALGRQISGIALSTLGSKTVTLSSTGTDTSYTRVTVGGNLFNSTESANVAATGSGAIAASGTFKSYAVTAEGLTGEGSYGDVAVPYSATLLSKRTVTADNLVLSGNYLSGSRLEEIGAQTIVLRSVGADSAYTRVTVAGNLFNSTQANSALVTGSGRIAASGRIASCAVTGEGLTGEGSYGDVVVVYTATVVGNATADTSGVPSAFGAPLEARLTASSSLAGLSSWIPADAQAVGTTASLLAGTFGATTGTVSMAWRTRMASETALLAADVMDLHTGTGVLNSFVLQMSYDPAQLASGVDGICLGWLNENNRWVNAVAGNIGTNTGTANFQGSWLAAGSPMELGTWGVDADGRLVWAVVNHNSLFSVIPEPGTAGLFALSVAGLLLRRRRKVSSPQTRS